MKRISFFLLAVTVSILTFSQSLVVTGDTLIVGNPNLQLTSHLIVTNTANKSLDVRCRMTPIINVPTTEFSFCWAEQCYAVGTTLSLKTTIASGQTVVYPDLEAHSGYYDAYGLSSMGKVEYCFFDDSDSTDITCFIVTFNAITTAIEDKYLSEKISNFYPNPSKDYTNIFYTAKEKCTIAIVDILGNQLKTITLNQVGNQKIFIGDLPNGMYFGRITTDGNLLAIKKLIIKR